MLSTEKCGFVRPTRGILNVNNDFILKKMGTLRCEYCSACDEKEFINSVFSKARDCLLPEMLCFIADCSTKSKELIPLCGKFGIATVPWTLFCFYKNIDVLRQNYADMMKSVQNPEFCEHEANNKTREIQSYKLESHEFEYCRALYCAAVTAEALGDYQKSDELATLFIEKRNRIASLNENDFTSLELAQALLWNLLAPGKEILFAKKLNERVFYDGYEDIETEACALCTFGYVDTVIKANKNIPVTCMYKNILGLNINSSDQLVLYPSFIKELSHVKGEFNSRFGKITIERHSKDGLNFYSFESPCDTTLILPYGDIKTYRAGKNSITFTVYL